MPGRCVCVPVCMGITLTSVQSKQRKSAGRVMAVVWDVCMLAGYVAQMRDVSYDEDKMFRC